MATNLKLASKNEVTIDKGIPVPAKDGPRWPLRNMEVGDSFSFDKKTLPALRSAIAYEMRVNTHKKFTVRSLPTENRCWRIA